MDIDIDIKKGVNIPEIIPEVRRASMVHGDSLEPHLVGWYLQEIPIDAISGVAAIPYKAAEEFGYLKFDILNLNLLNGIQTRDQLVALASSEPDWDMLLDKDIVGKLFHLSNNYDLLARVKPRSTLEIADTLALLRPNKVHLVDKYMKDREGTRVTLYTKTDKSDLRKSHAIAYAMNVVVQLNMIKENEAARNQ